ncbi:MAG: M28 family metallopeptidase [Caldilineaceae bacterium]
MATNPFLAIDQQMVGDIYTSPEIMENLTILCDDFGSRFGGTVGEKQAADFIKAKLESYGLQNVHLEPVEYIGWVRGAVTLEILSPVQMTMDCITLPHSPPADLEAVIVDMGDGGPLDFEENGDQVAGKVAMVNSKTQPRGSKRWVHRMEKYGRSILAGATGFIFVNHYPAYGPATGGVGDNDEGLIPAISVSYEDGAFLSRLIKRHGEVKIRLTSTDHCTPMTSWNILGDLPGNAEDPEIVMLGCHYDGHDISQGAIDPASGAVAVLEAARVLAQYAGKLPHTLRFALWGVEEIGLIGSHAYVDHHQDMLDNIRFYFNMDAAGGARSKDIVINEWPALETLIRGWQKTMALDFMVGKSISAHSDHFPFLLAGVPTGGLEPVQRDLSGRGYGHTRYDTLDKAEIRNLRDAAALAARFALRVANETAWPVSRRSKAEVAKLFDKPDYNEERSIMNEIANFVAEQRAK